MSNQTTSCTVSYEKYNQKFWNNQKRKMMVDSFLKNATNEQKLKFWIKTLLSSYSVYPEIIKTVDKIIELQASSISFASEIYDYNKTTFKQMDAIIDLSERKDTLLNIFIMTKQIMYAVTGENHEILEKRFCMNCSVEEIAREYGVSVRTAYRKIDRIIDEIYRFCKSQNWSLKFIESQVNKETWLVDRFKKIISDYVNNSYNIKFKKLFDYDQNDS